MSNTLIPSSPIRPLEPAVAGIFAKAAACKAVDVGSQLYQLKSESGQLSFGACQAATVFESQVFLEGVPGGSPLGQLDKLDKLSVAESARFVGCTRQAIHDAIRDGKLPATRVQVESGIRKGRSDFQIPADALFAFCPQARINWQAHQAALAYDAQLTRDEQEAEARRQKLVSENPSKTTYANACLWHLQEFQRFLEITRTHRTYGRTLYTKALQTGELEVPEWIRTSKATVSPRSLERWEQKLREGGPAALDPQWKSLSTPNIERRQDVKTYAIGLIAQRPHIKSKKLWEALKAVFNLEVVGSESSVSRWFRAWKEANPEEYLRMLNPDRAKSQFQVAFGSRSEDVLRLNQLWETDATKNDLFFLGDAKRYTLCQVVDVYSGRVKFLITDEPKGLAHGLLFRACILEWGLPEIAKTDNGKDYTSEYMAALFANLGIQQVLCRPFSGDEKPHVERSFRTFLHDLVELLPGYTGHNVAQAQDLRSQKTFAQRLQEAKKGDAVEVGMTREEFESFMTRWLATEEHRVRTSGRLAGKSPAQMVNEWAAEHPVRRAKDPLALDQLILPAVERTVGKKGIREAGQWFISAELGEIIGRKVQVRRSPEDMGRISVFKDGAFFCLAEDPTLTGVSRAEVAARAREHQKAVVRKEAEIHREAKRLVKPKDVAMAILRDRERAIDPVTQFQTAFPVATDAMAAASLAQAAELVASRTPHPAPITLTPEQAEEIRARIPAPRVPLEDPMDRFIRLLNAMFRSPEDQAFFDEALITLPICARLYEISRQKQA